MVVGAALTTLRGGPLLPDIDSLRCFEAASTELSFRAAASRVGLSPGAFSDRIKRLEELLDVQLFTRTTRRVALTPAGRRLLPVARRTLEEARRCVEVARDDGLRVPFELTVGTRFELGLSFLTPALDDLAAARPERTVHLYFGDSADLLAALRAGRVDAVVSSVRLTRGDITYATLHPEQYTFVAARALAADRPLDAPADAAHHTLLDIGPALPLFRYLLDGGGTEDWPFEHTSYLGTIGAIRQRCLAGRGVAVLPRYFVQPDLDAGALVELLPERKPRADAFRLLWRRSDPREAELRELAAALRARPLS